MHSAGCRREVSSSSRLEALEWSFSSGWTMEVMIYFLAVRGGPVLHVLVLPSRSCCQNRCYSITNCHGALLRRQRPQPPRQFQVMETLASPRITLGASKRLFEKPRAKVLRVLEGTMWAKKNSTQCRRWGNTANTPFAKKTQDRLDLSSMFPDCAL